MRPTTIILSLALATLFALALHQTADAQPLDAGAELIDAGHPAPPATAGEAVDRAIDEGVEGDWLAALVGGVLALGIGLRRLFKSLREGRIVGWVLNIALSAAALLFVYLGADLKLDSTFIAELVELVGLVAGGWNAVKGVPGIKATQTAKPAVAKATQTAKPAVAS